MNRESSPSFLSKASYRKFLEEKRNKTKKLTKTNIMLKMIGSVLIATSHFTKRNEENTNPTKNCLNRVHINCIPKSHLETQNLEVIDLDEDVDFFL